MAFFDWNHDGQKDYVDTAIEMMIIDDIENEQSGNAQNVTYRSGTTGNPGEGAAMWRLIRLILIIAMAAAVVVNIIGLFAGIVNLPGLIIAAVVLVILVKSKKKIK